METATQYHERLIGGKIDDHIQKEKDLQFVRKFLQSRVDDNLAGIYTTLDYKNMAGRWIKVKDQLEMAVNLEKSLNKWVDWEINHFDLTELVNEHLKE